MGSAFTDLCTSKRNENKEKNQIFDNVPGLVELLQRRKMGKSSASTN